LWQVQDSSLRIGFADLALLVLFCYLFKRKNPDFKFFSNWQSVFSGVLLILLSLSKIVSLFWFEPEFIALGWWAINLGLILILLGFKNIKLFWLEILLLCLFLAPLKPILAWIFDLRVPTAIAATFGLHYFGLEVVRNGSLISMAARAVDVNQGCTALDLLTQTYKFVILIFLGFSLSSVQKLKICLLSLLIPFSISVLRVMLLTIIVSDRPAFVYWHTGGGGNWFALASLLICGFAWLKVIGNISTVKFEAVNIPSVSSLQRFSLIFLAATFLVIFGSSFINPAIAKRDVSPYQFPNKLANSSSASNYIYSPVTGRENQGDGGYYAHNLRVYYFDQDNHSVTFILEYLIGTNGNVSDLYSASFAKPDINLQKVGFSEKNSYLFGQDQKNAYFTTCLFSNSISRVNPIPWREELQDLDRFSQNLTN
jgi:exosortase/archaeosortase family protein